MNPVISVTDLTKRYGDLTAADGVSFEVRAGEIFGLLGPNGAGKTTTVECLQGLRAADGGRIDVLGFDPARNAAGLRRLIGSQLQESSLPERLRVAEALEFFSSLQPAGPPWRDVMEEWGLTDKARAPFGTLSGGQRQRLLVALALVNAPQVVFLDEMTTGLDPAARRATWDLIERIRSAGTTVVLVTHFMDEAERLCDRIALVNRGRIVATGSPRGLVEEHGDGVTVRFGAELDDTSFLAAAAGVRSVTSGGGTITVHGDPTIPVTVGKALGDRGILPGDFEVVRPTLEDVYLRLVGGAPE